MKKFLTKAIITVWRILEFVYAPIYIASWALHKLARLLLAVSYLGMLEKQICKDIIRHLFDWHGKH